MGPSQNRTRSARRRRQGPRRDARDPRTRTSSSTGPILFKGFEGRDARDVRPLERDEVFEGFHYLDELHGEDTVTLRFKATVADGTLEIEGIDFLELDSDGNVAELTVFLRPLKAVNAFNE